MLKIGVFQKKDELLAQVLFEAFKECGYDAEILLNSGDADICVLTSECNVKSCNSKIVILPNSMAISTNASEIITYGLCCKNTLTVSSCIGNNMVFSLQRTILTHSGARVDVQDFPATLSDPDEPELVLATVAVLLAADVPVSQISLLPF